MKQTPRQILMICLTVLAFEASANGRIEPKTLWPSQPIVQARDCVLVLIAPKMHVLLKPEIDRPVIRPETSTALKDYQDSIEKFWDWRPDAFLNVFVPLKNEIFLFTEVGYYRSRGRSIFDSLAHELAHYLQFTYRGADMADESLEGEAVQVQTWFRETYRAQFQGDEFVCPISTDSEKTSHSGN